MRFYSFRGERKSGLRDVYVKWEESHIRGRLTRSIVVTSSGSFTKVIVVENNHFEAKSSRSHCCSFDASPIDESLLPLPHLEGYCGESVN